MGRLSKKKKVDEALLRKVLEYRERLIELLRDERIVRSLLNDPQTRYKLFYVAGALKIPIPLTTLTDRTRLR